MIALGDEVDPAWAGRAVAAHTGERGGSGGYAEQVAVAVGDLIAVPDGLGLPEAAALLHDGSTALGLLEEVGVKPGEQVLVTAAAGGMGVLLVQLARAVGASVIGAAQGRPKLDVVRDVGADAAVDYSEPDRARHRTGVPAGSRGRCARRAGGQDRRGQDADAHLTAVGQAAPDPGRAGDLKSHPESLDLSRSVRLGCFPSIPAGREAHLPAALTLWSEEGGHDRGDARDRKRGSHR